MNTVRKLLPFLNWPLTLNTVRSDFVAGITVSLLAIPQSLAYAQLAGVPAYYGLYAALIPTLVGALFGSSSILSTGPVAMTSLLTAASLVTLAAPGSEQFYSYAILLSLISGLFQIAFGLMRMGVLLNFLSHPVLMGFINAAAIIIVLSQLPAILGVSPSESQHVLTATWQSLIHMDSMHEMSFLFALAALMFLFGFTKIFPRWPGVLITVSVLTFGSFWLGYENMGGQVIGNIPAGMPDLSIPPLDWRAFVALLPASFVIALISFMEAMSSCKVIALKNRTPWDQNQELIGQGLAKVAAAFCQSMPVSGSFSRSALNLAAGARTGISSIFSAFFVLLTLLFFTPLLYHLPKPVLAAIIVIAVARLFDFRSIVRAWRASRDDGTAALVTFIATLAFAPDIHIGILTGILLSLAMLLYRLMRPRTVIVGWHDDGTLRDAERFGLPALHPQLGALRFDGRLCFVNVSYFEEAIINLQRRIPGLKVILIVGSGINGIDASGVEMLFRLNERMQASGVNLSLSSLKRQVMDVLERTGLNVTLGHDNIFSNDSKAVETLVRRIELMKIECAGAPPR